MKFDKRKLLGPLFIPLSRVRHSQATRISLAVLMMPAQIIRGRLNHPYFPVKFEGSRGMGALLRDAILACNYAEQNDLIVQLSSENQLYSSNKNTDVIETYFGPEDKKSYPGLRPLKVRNEWSFLHLKFEHHISISEASRIFWTYLTPKPFITDKVNAVLADVPNGRFGLSLHYRGTDKAREAPMADFSIFKDEIVRYQRARGPLSHVFLATDEPAFAAYLGQAFPGIIFHSYQLGEPTDYTRGRHFSDMSAEDKAIEAIVNMLLLGKAPCMVRCASHLSAMSKIIHPGIQTITVNRTHWGSRNFPEKEIIAEEHPSTSSETDILGSLYTA